MNLMDHQHGLCLFGDGGGLATQSTDTAKAIGVRTCPTPAVLDSRADNTNACAGCLDGLADERKLADQAHPIRTLAEILRR